MEIRISNNILTIFFDGKVDYSIASYFTNILSNSAKSSFQTIELNFQNTKFTTLPGAMYILFIVQAIWNSKNKLGLNCETRLSNCSENLLNSLANFGLINILKNYGNLKVDNYVDELSNSRVQFWKKKVKKSDSKLNNLYWPISILPLKTSNYFEDEISSFMNNFIGYFTMLIEYEFLENVNAERLESFRRNFISTINEATKNVWDHSESWGAASIYSHRENKSTFCLFDYGIGFINSYIKRKGFFERNLENDIEILKWLFVEGNTSNEINNHGRGLAKIAQFVNVTEGVLLIHTDKYIMRYDRKGLNVRESTYFPGTQIMINF